MNNVLLIDDEPIIVETTYNMLKRIEHLDLIVWKAHSAHEGLDIMRNNRIDILITDVRMPIMTGLELIKHVRKQWSRCKVIFLSGYSDYEYLQTALQHHAFDYLLKPVEDEKIIETVQRVIAEIDAELQMNDIMSQAETQLQKANYLLQKDFFEALFDGAPQSLDFIAGELQSLHIPLEPNENVILMMGRVDRWPQHFPLKDKLLLQYAINNIVEEFLREACRIVPVTDDRYLVWFIQHRTVEQSDDLYDIEEKRDPVRLQWYINELLEKIQHSVQQYLQLPVSFILSKPNVGWLHIHHAYKEMAEWMQRGIGLDEGIIWVEKAGDMLQNGEQELLPKDIKRYINQLTNTLESGDKKEFNRTLADFFRITQKAVFLDFTLQMEIFAHLSAMYLSFINARKISRVIGGELDLTLLSNYNSFAHWSAFEEFCIRLSEALFSHTELEKRDQKKEIAEKVDAYIVKYINQNITLDQISKHFHLSPYYLSRLYHAEKGIPLSERMKLLKLTQAKELLLMEGKKIHEVALELGFYNVSYFGKFFKKNTGITPQEYKLNNT